ncbi:putative thiamine biosynthesis oxidoreductase ThiO isoform X1 [Medicago truncatula]|uniref:putative thiamine biosynthesis oxidoreductase ThiO isoform X1 n=1 Tax=Medicago truncatula TaxID=3880 RepID=UPI000D2F2FF5|nr:putative thiamine biosynthesis oxidoreductase ThiO isoform X1 [Medicago truncatula]
MNIIACRSHPNPTILPYAPHSSLTHQYPLRFAVLGAGFAGLSVVWHLLNQSPKELNLNIHLYDEFGIGGGASGISGGLLHPYSPKVKPLWEGAQCWEETINLFTIAQQATQHHIKPFLPHKRGILRPAMDIKNMTKLNHNAKTSLPCCRVQTLNNQAAQTLLPGLCLPFDTAFFMPQALNINPRHYLEALFLACENLVKESSSLYSGEKQLILHKKSIHGLSEFEVSGEYDAVIVCLGAKVNMLPEISGRLPLRTCRGVIVHLEPPDNTRCYPEHGPSILSDAWISVQGSRSLNVGSTWEWKSINSSSNVSTDEASKALHQLLPKASAIYPGIKDWVFTGAKAGLRAMPPLTPHGSLPLLGCINDFIGRNHSCKYWLFGGLGSRGLLYHGWLGSLMAHAVLSCNEEVIPSELTSWKNIKPKF